ncbi:MAG: hypothetical protein H6Q93_1591 [Nitrospirae bacterium]|nr:hypothetical protein [Nitrospirota bacterium]
MKSNAVKQEYEFELMDRTWSEARSANSSKDSSKGEGKIIFLLHYPLLHRDVVFSRSLRTKTFQHTSIFELRVAKGDVGKVIGKDGRTAQSMRIILAGASTKVRRRSVLEIVD